jgi:hypothetical protein
MLDTLPLCKSLGLPSAEKNTEQSKPNAPGPPELFAHRVGDDAEV